MSEEKKEEKTTPINYVLRLDENKVNLILAALGEMPAKHSMFLIAEIQQQCKGENK